MTFLNSILNKSKKHEFPFNHWEYYDALSNEAILEIIKADIPDVSKYNLKYDGTRAIDGGTAEFREGIISGGQAIKLRCFVTKKNEMSLCILSLNHSIALLCSSLASATTHTIIHASKLEAYVKS